MCKWRVTPLQYEWHMAVMYELRMGWLRLVGSLKLYVSFAEYSLFYRQKHEWPLSLVWCHSLEVHGRRVQTAHEKIFSKNDRSLLQKSPTKETTFCQKTYNFKKPTQETRNGYRNAKRNFLGKWKVYFAKEPYKRNYILQKRLIILRSLCMRLEINFESRE